MKVLKGVCSYCRVTYRHGEEPASHGVCDRCARVVKTALARGGNEIAAVNRDMATSDGRAERIEIALAARPKVNPADLVESDVFAGFMEPGR